MTPPIEPQWKWLRIEPAYPEAPEKEDLFYNLIVNFDPDWQEFKLSNEEHYGQFQVLIAKEMLKEIHFFAERILLMEDKPKDE